MALLDDLVQENLISRVEELERRVSKPVIEGDFDGSVTGKWVKLDQSGAGVVEYNGKQYTTKPIGFTSVPAGTAVEMTFANGVYYSKW